MIMVLYAPASAYERAGKSVQITVAQAPCVVYVFFFLDTVIICRLYKLTLSYEAQVTVQLRVTVFLI